jgi:YHS domain-containing protein
MRHSSPSRILAGLLFAFLSLPLLGQAPAQKPAGPQAKPATAATSQIVKADIKKVCMIHNQVYKNDQIPVSVDGRTYYAFCDMCKSQLANDPETRSAFDPVSGKKVDKAKAFIGMLPDNTVLYFESEKTFEQYKSGKH